MHPLDERAAAAEEEEEPVVEWAALCGEGGPVLRLRHVSDVIDSGHLSEKPKKNPWMWSSESSHRLSDSVMRAGLLSWVPKCLTTTKHRKRAALEEHLGGKAARFRFKFAFVVVQEFANVGEFEPQTFQAQALRVASMSEQAAYTQLPTARKSRGQRGKQFLVRRHCPRFAKLQETLDFNFYFYSMIGIRLDIQNVDQVAENHKVHYVPIKFPKQYFKLGTK
jgi:hypothetical protein